MKIFLGYPSERLKEAELVYRCLSSTCEDVLFDKVSLIGADAWDHERERAQKDTYFAVHILSNDVVKRRGVVNREIRASLKMADDQPLGSNYLLIIRADEVRLPPDLLRYHYVDLSDTDWQKKVEVAVAKRRYQLQVPLEAQDGDFLLYPFFDQAEDPWPLLLRCNLDTRGLTVNFSPYDVLLYAAGTHEVFSPWSFFGQLLDDKYSAVEKLVGPS